jgi:hypothetical protein
LGTAASQRALLATLVLVPLVASAVTQRAQLLVSAYVPPRTLVSPVALPATVELTAADLRQGYKDVPAVYHVSNNVARGYVLQFATRGGPASKVELRGLGQPIELGQFGADVARLGRPLGDDELKLSYRLHLADGVPAGVYALPVLLSAVPL